MGAREKSRRIQRMANSWLKKFGREEGKKRWAHFAADLVLRFNLADDAAIIIAKHHLGVKDGKTRAARAVSNKEGGGAQTERGVEEISGRVGETAPEQAAPRDGTQPESAGEAGVP